MVSISELSKYRRAKYNPRAAARDGINILPLKNAAVAVPLSVCPPEKDFSSSVLSPTFFGYDSAHSVSSSESDIQVSTSTSNVEPFDLPQKVIIIDDDSEEEKNISTFSKKVVRNDIEEDNIYPSHQRSEIRSSEEDISLHPSLPNINLIRKKRKGKSKILREYSPSIEIPMSHEELETSDDVSEDNGHLNNTPMWPPLDFTDQTFDSEDYTHLTGLDTLSSENSFYECAGWMVRNSNLLFHVAQRNMDLERENNKMKNEAIELRNKFSNLQRREAKVTDLENELLDKNEKLEIANDLIKEFEKEIQDFETSEENYVKEKKTWWDRSIVFHQTITNNSEALSQKIKELQQVREELNTWSSCIDEIKVEQFDNAVKQVQLVHQNSTVNSSFLFPSGFVEDGKIIDATTKMVLYPSSEGSQATASFTNV